jgi:hypothetical protein
MSNWEQESFMRVSKHDEWFNILTNKVVMIEAFKNFGMRSGSRFEVSIPRKYAEVKTFEKYSKAKAYAMKWMKKHPRG